MTTNLAVAVRTKPAAAPAGQQAVRKKPAAAPAGPAAAPCTRTIACQTILTMRFGWHKSVYLDESDWTCYVEGMDGLAGIGTRFTR